MLKGWSCEENAGRMQMDKVVNGQEWNQICGNDDGVLSES
tara:strand:+ start:486 stop:605 length:120 start_codon:yes stop_codon:yes gene_type:complete